jgi:hypothetical protein
MVYGWHAYGERHFESVRITRRHEGAYPSSNKEVQRKDRYSVASLEIKPNEQVAIFSKRYATTYTFDPIKEGEILMKLHEPVLVRPIEYGLQKIYRFDNGFGASVIKSQFSYGGDDNLWELAVLTFSSDAPEEFELTYETPITNDVIGSLNDDEVEEKLTEVKQLTWRHSDGHVRNSNNHIGGVGDSPASEVYKKEF